MNGDGAHHAVSQIEGDVDIVERPFLHDEEIIKENLGPEKVNISLLSIRVVSSQVGGLDVLNIV